MYIELEEVDRYPPVPLEYVALTMVKALRGLVRVRSTFEPCHQSLPQRIRQKYFIPFASPRSNRFKANAVEWPPPPNYHNLPETLFQTQSLFNPQSAINTQPEPKAGSLFGLQAFTSSQMPRGRSLQPPIKKLSRIRRNALYQPAVGDFLCDDLVWISSTTVFCWCCGLCLHRRLGGRFKFKHLSVAVSLSLLVSHVSFAFRILAINLDGF